MNKLLHHMGITKGQVVDRCLSVTEQASCIFLFGQAQDKIGDLEQQVSQLKQALDNSEQQRQTQIRVSGCRSQIICKQVMILFTTG